MAKRNRMKTNISILSARELERKIREEEIRVIDVRTPGEFGNKRISRSLNIPLNAFGEEISELTTDDEKGLPLCIVCQSGVRAEKASKMLSADQFESVFLLAGGLDNWVHEKLPVEKDAREVIPLDRQVRITIGTLILIGTAACYFLEDTRWLLAPAFFGAGLVFSGVTGFCGLAKILSVMPWNR